MTDSPKTIWACQGCGRIGYSARDLLSQGCEGRPEEFVSASALARAEQERDEAVAQREATDILYARVCEERNAARSQLAAVAAWFAVKLAADEIGFVGPVPRALRDPAADELVRNPQLGWPDKEAALAFLDELYEWLDSPPSEEER